MNLQQLRDSGWIIYECLSGSHAYDTNIEGSDKDYRGVFIQPTRTLLGTQYFPQIGDEKNDTTFYEIGNFIQLLVKGNPNMLELLNMPEECVVYKNEIWDKIFTTEIKAKFITTKLKHTFTGYAYAQIKKANSLDKMMNWEQTRVERRDVLDFCYVLTRGSDSVLFKQWEKEGHKIYPGGSMMEDFGGGIQVPVERIVIPDRSVLGLSNVNNFPDLYAAYYLESGGGIVSESSNDVQLRSIPKNAPFLFYLRFNKTAYSQHCRDYKQYQDWLKARNVQRYVDIEGHGQQIDGKNLLHTVRLLNMSKDIAESRGIVVRRPEAEYLKDIRKGKYNLQEIIDSADSIIEDIGRSFDNSELPHEVSNKFINELITNIRINNYECGEQKRAEKAENISYIVEPEGCPDKDR